MPMQPLQGQCGTFGSVSLSLSLFVFESAPTGPWQTPEKPFTVHAVSEQAKEGPISWELSLKQAAHKKKKEQGEAVSVFKNGWGSVQWLPNTDTRTK